MVSSKGSDSNNNNNKVRGRKKQSVCLTGTANNSH